MRRTMALIAGVFAVASSPSAMSKTSAGASTVACQHYVGQTVQTISFAELSGLVPHGAPTRGEYETSAQFAARVAQATPVFTQPIIVGQQLERPLIAYDADTQILRISAFAFGLAPLVPAEIVSALGPGTGARLPVPNLGFTIREETVGTRVYDATNGFGAKFTVDETTQVEEIVWEGSLKIAEERFVGERYQQDLADIPMGLEQARAIKTEAWAAIVLVPRSPFFAEAKTSFDATFSDPHATVVHSTVIGADIQCGLLLNKANEVLYAFDVK